MEKNNPLLLDIWEYLKERKAWWLAPVIIVFLIVAGIIVLGQSSAVSPIVYALF